jgi:hypothetical protein
MSVKAHLKVTHQEADSLGYAPFLKVFSYDFSDFSASHTVMFPIEAGTRVLGVMHRVVAAFDGADQALIVGDSASSNLYFKTGEIAVGTAGDFKWIPVNVAAAAGAITVVQGPPVTATAANPTITVTARAKSYAAANYLLLTFAAAATVGAGEICVLMSGMEG